VTLEIMLKSDLLLGPLRAVSPYGFAVMAVGTGVVTTSYLGSGVKHTPTLFFCSVVLSSWFGGVWAAVFASLLSAIAMDYYFIAPLGALGISQEEAPDMILFVASALFVSWLSTRHKRAKDKLRQSQRNKLDAQGETTDRAEISGVTIHAFFAYRIDAPQNFRLWG
jgi:K+-sensing histidine kinase KdpD